MGEFVVGSSDAAELFDAGKEPFNQVAMLVSMLIEGALLLACGAGRDNGLCRHVGNLVEQGIGIERFVRDDDVGLQSFQQGGGLGDIMTLSTGQAQRARLPRPSTKA